MRLLVVLTEDNEVRRNLRIDDPSELTAEAPPYLASGSLRGGELADEAAQSTGVAPRLRL